MSATPVSHSPSSTVRTPVSLVAAGGRTLRCFDPATEELLGEAPIVSAEEVRQRVARARRAQQAWGRTSFAERRRVLERIQEHLLDHAEDLCRVICRDAGKTLENALMGEIWPICEKIRHTLSAGEADLQREEVSAGLLMHKRAFIEFPALGVIGVICPWNYPLQNVMAPTIPALFAGNAVVVKVSEWTSYSAPRFQAIFDEVLGSLGHSTDLVQVITGDGETGAALCRSGVDKIVFTGSMKNGQRVAAQAAETLTPVILELGGKDAFVVCDDADLEQAAHAALAGVYIAAGQMCLGAERFYVMDGIHDRFVQRVVELVKQLRIGPPLGPDGLGMPFGEVDVGAMTMPGQVDIVERLVNDAVARGARVLVGGHRREINGAGQYFEPTVLCDVDHSMAITREETFGPVMCLMRVRSDDEAIRLANDSAYGLGSTVLSKDAARARRIGQAIVAGSTSINDFGLPYMANALPFGGVGGSGFGRLNGREGLRAMCNIKSVLEDRLPLHSPVKLYPVGPHDFARNRAVIELLYRRGLKARAGAALELARQLGQQLLGTLRGSR